MMNKLLAGVTVGTPAVASLVSGPMAPWIKESVFLGLLLLVLHWYRQDRRDIQKAVDAQTKAVNALLAQIQRLLDRDL